MKPGTPPLPRLSARLIPPAGGLLPGDLLTAVLEVSVPSPLALIEVDVSLTGVERVDSAWVSSEWRAGVAPINTDTRRIQRPLITTSLCAACQTEPVPAKVRRFVIQTRLPSWLPPSFRGSTLRVAYQLAATIRYQDASPAQDSSHQETPLSPPGMRPARAVLQHSVRVGVTLWPGPGAAGRAALRALLAPLPPAPVMRCWEVGAGTDLRQALEHLATLRLEDARGVGEQEGKEHEEEEEEEWAGKGGRSDAPGVGDEVQDGDAWGRLPQSITHTYALRMGSRPLARVSLLPPVEGGATFVPGDTLSILIDFEQRGSLRCMQVEVTLESEELVAPGWHAGGASPRVARSVVAEALEAGPHTAAVGVLLGLPRSATPGFATPLCTLSWVLHFVFTSVTQGPDAAPGTTPWHRPAEQLTWRLPVEVVGQRPTVPGSPNPVGA